MRIPVVLADDHAIVRRGLKDLLEKEDHCVIVGEAADGEAATEEILRHRPMVAVLDVQLPKLNGIEVLRRVRSEVRETRFVMLSMFGDEGLVSLALRSGASAYVLKEAAPTDLIAAVDGAVQGRRFLSPPLDPEAIEAYVARTEGSESVDRYALLTPREREVLRLAALGHSNAEIGERLVIGTRTVETHRANLMRKLRLQSQTDLVRYAVARAIIGPTVLPSDGPAPDEA